MYLSEYGVPSYAGFFSVSKESSTPLMLPGSDGREEDRRWELGHYHASKQGAPALTITTLKRVS